MYYEVCGLGCRPAFRRGGASTIQASFGGQLAAERLESGVAPMLAGRHPISSRWLTAKGASGVPGG